MTLGFVNDDSIALMVRSASAFVRYNCVRSCEFRNFLDLYGVIRSISGSGYAHGPGASESRLTSLMSIKWVL